MNPILPFPGKWKRDYEVEVLPMGTSSLVKITTKRANLSFTSTGTIVPLTIRYNEAGNYRIESIEELFGTIESHNYSPSSRDFPIERISDLEIRSIQKVLEGFPIRQTYIENQETKVNPIADLLYSNTILLKPDGALSKKLDSLPFTKSGKLLAKILAKLAEDLKELNGIHIDLFSVPKRDIGKFAYLADDDGYAYPVKILSFGYHKAMPADRRAREFSSLKNCEKFISPVKVPYDLPNNIRPFVSMLRVAVVFLEHSSEDSADVFPSAVPKIASELSRKIVIKDFRKIDKSKRNIQYMPYRTSVEIVHIDWEETNESYVTPGAIRLVLPGGVKVAAGLQESQGFSGGKPVDILMDFNTFVNKGAVATLAMTGIGCTERDIEFDECRDWLEGKMKNLDTIEVAGATYKGIVGEIPVMRPGQRYTELSKERHITTDLVFNAALGINYTIPQELETDYSKLRKIHQALYKEIKPTP